MKPFTLSLIAAFQLTFATSPEIIFLNGPSCSGKTTVAKQLQSTLSEPYLHLTFDQMVEMIPEPMKHWYEDPGFTGFSSQIRTDQNGKIQAAFEMGSYARSARRAFKEMCRCLSDQNLSLIIEDVFFSQNEVDDWSKALSGKDVLWVYLHAPLETLEEREKERRSFPGCANFQHYHAHRRAEYNLEIDTNQLNIKGITQEIAREVER